jgi:branched-chain amino acid transport system permease protein
MNTATQLVLSGLATGSIYGLIALAFLVINHATGIVNFAQGSMLMVGAVASFLVLSHFRLGYFAAVPLVLLVGLALAAVFNLGLVRPLNRRGAPLYSVVVGTIAFGVVLEEGAALLVGDEMHGVPPVVANKPLSLGGVSVLPQTLISVAVAWAVVGGVWLFFNRTLTGISLRAVGINRIGAAVSGIRVPRMIASGFVLSMMVICVAGLLIAPTIGAGPRMGLDLGVKGFAAAVLGGMSSVYRGMIAGLAIGVLETTSAYYLSSSYAAAIAYAVLLVALCLQPLRVKFARAA